MSKNGNYKISIESRMTSLEVKLEDLIKNHIPHLQTKIDRIQWLLVTNLLAVIFLLAQELIK